LLYLNVHRDGGGREEVAQPDPKPQPAT